MYASPAISQHNILMSAQPSYSMPPMMSHPVSQMHTSAQSPRRKDLLEALLPVRDHWKTIGLLLDCDDATLSDVATKGQNDNIACLRELVVARLKNIDPPLTWELVVEAVKLLDPQQAQVIMMLPAVHS